MFRSGSRFSTIKQGEFLVSNAPEDRFVCVLGSCIAACFFDPVARVGGMNHFLLPGRDPGATGEVKYGAHAMEQLVNAMLRSGAARNRLQVSIFGGAKVIKSAGQIGANNAQFARDFVLQERFRLLQTDVSGQFGRRLTFSPAIGTTKVEVLRTDAPLPRETHIPKTRRPNGSIELF